MTCADLWCVKVMLFNQFLDKIRGWTSIVGSNGIVGDLSRELSSKASIRDGVEYGWIVRCLRVPWHFGVTFCAASTATGDPSGIFVSLTPSYRWTWVVGCRSWTSRNKCRQTIWKKWNESGTDEVKGCFKGKEGSGLSFTGLPLGLHDFHSSDLIF